MQWEFGLLDAPMLFIILLLGLAEITIVASTAGALYRDDIPSEATAN